MSNAPALAPDVCERARLSRDARFDGLFFTAVRSTGIYCRPVCPAPPPKPRNVDYYPSAAAAESAGFRPCLRCRPELAPGAGSWRRGDDTLARALQLIDEGALADASLATLAARVQLGERQLRRLFVDRLGAAPVAVHTTRRLLFAKQLLTETALPVTTIAMESGFGSLRRFNAAFRDAYDLAPRDLRRELPGVSAGPLVLRLGYRPPYDFAAMLEFFAGRALPGIEQVDAHSYARVFDAGDGMGRLRISQWPAPARAPVHALRLELHGAPAGSLLAIVQRVRRMFDLDADPRAITAVLANDARLAPLLAARPGLRIPSGWDGFEIAVRAVIGQQVSVAAARTITTRLAMRHGRPVPMESAAAGFAHLFPDAATLAGADLDGLGLTGARATAVRAVATAVLDGRVGFSVDGTLEDFISRWTMLPGIGPWTAQYIALRALGHPDAFPAGDLVLQRAVTGDGSRLAEAALRARADAWRPWRAYAVIQLWRAASDTSAATPPSLPAVRGARRRSAA
ncbi:DNA-3-methyladenine glycosylase 2 family protein [Luteimonas yindakuii]|uniref:DNA-3-methyladenine glycosylase II n=1 Tax=Luteimonas yindakuii TaxID=2565782 RepID=A0A4Z1RED7_9GAMM|nr:AlkA N-terminal domain-containing protein [Luteimonas yindakuii]TKS54533.1 DNA-3-methyladenine glycosylase 2 family protein [Luteimonas yindakuii]